MKRLIIALTAALCACNGSDGGGGSGVIEFPEIAPTQITLTVKTGNGFECLLYEGTVFCRGVSANTDVGINSLDFIPYVTDTNSNIVALVTYDDIICFESSVSDRPYVGGAGGATYCIGEANLGVNYANFPIVYSGPPFSTASHGSPDISWASQPFMGGDITMNEVLNGSFMTDGTAYVTETQESCYLSNEGAAKIVCQSFEVIL